MSETRVWYFIKFFREEAHADLFMKGQLYLNRVSYFKKLEGEDDGRSDSNEAVSVWWQRDNLEITFSPPGSEKIKITAADLAGPVSMSFDFHSHFHVFCLYAMTTTGSETFENPDDCLAAMKKQLQVDERCFALGPFAVIVRKAPFNKQVQAALQRNGQWFRGDLVKYYDNDTFHGVIGPKEAPFWKQKRFAYQQEFRIVVETGTEGDDPITIDIGDISHISAKIASSAVDEAYTLKLEAEVSSTPKAPRETDGD
jgi:hypothetical protein